MRPAHTELLALSLRCPRPLCLSISPPRQKLARDGTIAVDVLAVLLTPTLLQSVAPLLLDTFSPKLSGRPGCAVRALVSFMFWVFCWWAAEVLREFCLCSGSFPRLFLLLVIFQQVFGVCSEAATNSTLAISCRSKPASALAPTLGQTRGSATSRSLRLRRRTI